MEKENCNVGLPICEDQQKKYLGEYVILYQQGGASVAGKLVNIVQDYFILNPFQAQKSNGKYMIYFLNSLNLGMSVPISQTRIEPSTEKDLLESYSLINSEREKEFLKQTQKIVNN